MDVVVSCVSPALERKTQGRDDDYKFEVSVVRTEEFQSRSAKDTETLSQKPKEPKPNT